MFNRNRSIRINERFRRKSIIRTKRIYSKIGVLLLYAPEVSNLNRSRARYNYVRYAFFLSRIAHRAYGSGHVPGACVGYVRQSAAELTTTHRLYGLREDIRRMYRATYRVRIKTLAKAGIPSEIREPNPKAKQRRDCRTLFFVPSTGGPAGV